MTLDEAIKHAEEVAKKQENNAKNYPRPDKSVKGSGKKYNAYLKCAEEHRQLAEWLKELKQLKEQVSNSEKPNKWVSVLDQLPEKEGLYIVTREYPWGSAIVDTSYWFKSKLDNHGFSVSDRVIAWMPIEPYKQEVEE